MVFEYKGTVNFNGVPTIPKTKIKVVADSKKQAITLFVNRIRAIYRLPQTTQINVNINLIEEVKEEEIKETPKLTAKDLAERFKEMQDKSTKTTKRKQKVEIAVKEETNEEVLSE